MLLAVAFFVLQRRQSGQSAEEPPEIAHILKAAAFGDIGNAAAVGHQQFFGAADASPMNGLGKRDAERHFKYPAKIIGIAEQLRGQTGSG